MAQYLVSDTYLYNIADAIREKLSTTATYTPGEMSGAISSIQVATAPLLQTKTVTPQEYQQIIQPDNPNIGLSQVTVSAVSTTYVGSKVTRKAAATITPTTTNQIIAINTYLTGAQTIQGDTNLVAGNIKSGVSIFGVSGSYTGSGGGTPSLQTKINITPTESSQTITADSGYDGLSSVQINAISSTYIGSGITTNPTPTANGKTVTIPAGYYSTQTTKDVSTGSATGPSTISSSSANISTGTNTITLTKTGIATTPTVTAGYVVSATQSTATVTLSASVTTKAAATITPTTSNQTIASGTYLTGTQTISGDANLVAGNIKSGISIFGITGSYEGSGSGSASNIRQGTFTTGSTGASTGTVDTGYTGSGYPIALFIYVDGGAYNNGTDGNTTWYNSLTRYDCGWYGMVKSRTTDTPTYTTSGAVNQGTAAIIYKNSTSAATTYTRTSSMTANTFSSSNAAASTVCARFKGNGKTISYYVGNATSSTIGFPKNTTMAYIAIYSS